MIDLTQRSEPYEIALPYGLTVTLTNDLDGSVYA